MNTRRTFEQLNTPCKIKGVVLNIGMYESCIVGETLDLKKRHGIYNHYYESTLNYHDGCTECNRYSQNFHHNIEQKNKKELEYNLKYFAKHLEEKHPKLVKRKVKRMNK